MITFKNRVIPTAAHGSLLAQAPALISRENEFFGLHGVSEIVGGRGPREVIADIWLSDRQWTGAQPTQLLAELARLDALVGEHGTVKEQVSGGLGINRTIKECTFMGFTPLPLDGQEYPSPIRDEGRTLFAYGGGAGVGAWFMRGVLRWRQTSPG